MPLPLNCVHSGSQSESSVDTAMPYYRVLLQGENFWLQIEESQQRMGFFTTRFVKAETAEEAGKVAIDLIRSEGKLKPLNHPDDPPRVVVNETEEVDQASVPSVVRGFAFFPDEPENVH
jgi:hypothetical protein